MTLAELAEYLDVPRRRLRTLVEAQVGFPTFKIRGKWYADIDKVREWLLHRYEDLAADASATKDRYFGNDPHFEKSHPLAANRNKLN